MFQVLCLFCHAVHAAQQQELLQMVETWYHAAREDEDAFEALGAAIEAFKYTV